MRHLIDRYPGITPQQVGSSPQSQLLEKCQRRMTEGLPEPGRER